MHLVSCNCRCNHNLDIISCGTYMLRLVFISIIICLQAICELLQHTHGFELIYTLAMCVYVFFAEVRNRYLDSLYVKLFYCLSAALINESHIFPYCFIEHTWIWNYTGTYISCQCLEIRLLSVCVPISFVRTMVCEMRGIRLLAIRV